MGEIFRFQIRDNRGRKPPMSPLNVKFDAKNFWAKEEKHPSPDRLGKLYFNADVNKFLRVN